MQMRTPMNLVDHIKHLTRLKNISKVELFKKALIIFYMKTKIRHTKSNTQ